MHHANGDIGGLVFSQQNFQNTISDHCGTFNRKPVFGTVMEHLQRELRPQLNGNELHLEAVAYIDGVISSPGAVNFVVQFASERFSAFSRSLIF